MYENIIFCPKNLVFRKINDLYIVLNPDAPNLMVVDDVGKEIFELCKNGEKIENVIKCLCEKYADEVAKEDLVTLITSAIKTGFLRTSSPISSREVKRLGSVERLLYLHLHLTRACNLRCKHCFVSAGEFVRDELWEDKILTLIKELRDLGGEYLILTGGEPLLRKKVLYSAIKEARSQGLKGISVETNGTLLSEEDAAFFKRYEVGVGVSLDGVTPETNDYIRGAGVFERSIQAIKTLVKNDVRVSIGMTLMHHNIAEAEKMVFLAKELGVSFLSINPIRIAGRAKENMDLAVSPNETVHALVGTWKLARRLGVPTRMGELSNHIRQLGKKESCGAGVTTIGVAANGDVYPCNMFVGGSMKVGNVREGTLKRVMETSDILKKFRNFNVLDTECCDCELKYICGGCPAEAFEEYGDIKKRTPWCPVRKEIGWEIITNIAHELWQET